MRVAPFLPQRFRDFAQTAADLRKYNGHKLPPGPVLPAWVQTLRWAFQPIPFMEAARAQYGKVFTQRLVGFPPLIHFSDPEAIKEIFTGPPDLLFAGEANAILKPVLGSGSLLLLDGPSHLRHRRLLLPPFHGERMHAYGAAMLQVTERVMSTWPRGKVLPIMPEMRRIALDVILQTVFGAREGDAILQVRDELSDLIARASADPIFLLPAAHVRLGPLTSWARIQDQLARIDEAIFALIRSRVRDLGAHKETPGESTPPVRGDILSLLVLARDEDNQPLSEGELRDELMTLLVAGHDTVATGLSWTFYHLTQSPEVVKRAQQELDAYTTDQLPQANLPWVDAIVKESLRLTPVLPIVGRRLQEDMRLGGVDLPKGVRAAPNVYLVHRDPDIWPNPTVFTPERFLGSKPAPYLFFPFGGGVRRCIGMAFALFEMRIVLAAILKRLQVGAAPNLPIQTVRHGVALAPSNDMPIILYDR
ncbi:MAG: cytochrome P450 [Polyangiaceae bacterium]|nr:cytochrome P450 [Polyangiaceae bacterium]